MHGVFPYPERLRALAIGMRVVQRSGLRDALRNSGLLRRFAPALAGLDDLSPDFTRPFFMPADVGRYAPRGEPRARVALLTGCVMPLTFGETHHATVRVLARNGVQVLAPKDQVCCGALHAHSGDAEAARRLARVDIDRFLPLNPDAIIINSAGCGSHMKEYAHLLRNDAEYAEKAERFAALVKGRARVPGRDRLRPAPGRASLLGHLPRLLPLGARSADHGRAARDPAPHPRPRVAGDGKPRPLLWQRRHLFRSPA